MLGEITKDREITSRTSDNDAYPIIYARVGSIVEGGNISIRDLFDTPITITNFKKGGTGDTFMSGQSRYVHGEHMNKGTFGVSGAYGVSGVSKLTGSISGYVGNAVAQAAKQVTINYNGYLSAGVEFIDIDNLTIADLINALKLNPKNKILEVLVNYNKLKDSLKKCTPEEISNKEEFKAWSKSLEEFLSSYGDGFVVAVHWGAFGSVNMIMTSTDSGNSWNYGAAADFSYARTGASVSVKATYAGSQSSANAAVDVTVKSQFKGNAIRSLIDEWRKQVENKSFKDLADVDVLAIAPDLEVPSGTAPPIHEFTKPTKDNNVSENMGKIKDLKGLEAYAKAQAYDQYSKTTKDDPKLNLDDFLKNANNPAKNDKIDTLEDDAYAGLADLFNEPDDGNKIKSLASLSSPEMYSATDDSSSANEIISTDSNQDENFVPLGILIVNWSDIFPWLSRGYYNKVDDLTPAKEILQWRAMIQDFQTLAILYWTAANIVVGKKEIRGLNIGSGTTAQSVGNAFGNAASKLQEKLKEKETYFQKMTQVLNDLGKSERKIYRTWVENGFLRNAELGLGYLHEQVSITEFKILQYEKGEEYAGIKMGYGGARVDCNFQGNNHVVFAETNKFLPLIQSDGTIRAFGTVTDPDNEISGGYLGEYYYYKYDKKKKKDIRHGFWGLHPKTVKLIDKDKRGKVLHKEQFTPFVFKGDPQNHRLIYTTKQRTTLGLYPIPYSAAAGVNNWKGGAMGCANLASFTELQAAIGNLKTELENLNAWSFRSKSFENVDWKPELGLSDLQVETHYIGIFPEQKDLMKIWP